jgi:hypothetical protein
LRRKVGTPYGSPAPKGAVQIGFLQSTEEVAKLIEEFRSEVVSLSGSGFPSRALGFGVRSE